MMALAMPRAKTALPSPFQPSGSRLSEVPTSGLRTTVTCAHGRNGPTMAAAAPAQASRAPRGIRLMRAEPLDAGSDASIVLTLIIAQQRARRQVHGRARGAPARTGAGAAAAPRRAGRRRASRLLRR